jgi:hypothetical protein
MSNKNYHFTFLNLNFSVMIPAEKISIIPIT